jgi:formylmethanofuran dehydrogenase subunit C
MFRLILKKVPELFVDLETLRPEEIEDMTLNEVRSLPLKVGNSEISLSEIFEVEENDEEELILMGDLSRTRNLGLKMRRGRIIVEGRVGMHIGCQMKGGEILIRGNVDSWCGCEMGGGRIVIEGSAGDYIGSGYRGSERGMRGGEILINGSAGDFIGEFMSGGVIEIKGDVGVHAGSNMIGGEIKIGGVATIPGGGMREGIMKIEKIKEMLPSFKYEFEEDGYFVFSGDYAVNGKGRIYVRRIEE